jgi:hypothetical protein
MLKRFLFTLTFTTAAVGYSQLTSLNPYSSYGIGNQILATDGIQYALGGSTIAFSDSTMVSYYNSASIASLTKNYPLFSLGVNGAISNFTEGNNSYTRPFAALNQLILAVPFKRRYGISLGLAPYARRGYEFIGQQAIGNTTDTVIFDYSGNGSIGKGFVGLSFKVLNKPKYDFSIGSNVGYLFGTVTNSRKATLQGESKTGLALQSDRLQSFHYDFSFSGKYVFNDKNRIQINGFLEPSQQLTGRFADELYDRFPNPAAPTTFLISLVSSVNTKATYITGSTLRLGGNYTTSFQRNTKKNKVFDSQLMFLAEYVSTSFSDFRKDFNSESLSSYTADYNRLSFGLQYTPNTDFYRNLNPTGFFNQVKYRVGTYTSSLPFSYQGEVFREFGTTFGFGIPLITSNSYSSINFGFDLGKRSNSVAGSLNEKYIGFNIGIIIAPSKADYWFRKVKLD